MNTLRTNQLLHISVFFIFIGRAYQHMFWDAPYRTLFWDEALLKPIIEGVFNGSWQTYVTSLYTDGLINCSIRIIGFIYLSAAFVTILLLRFKHWILNAIIFVSGCSLLILSVLLTKEKFYHVAQFFEHSIQFGLPFILLYSRSLKVNQKKLLLLLKISIAATFFSHGLYAFGFYPVPGKFVDMVIQILGVNEQQSITLLYIAGLLDFIIAILIFIPRVSRYALLYAMAWGFVTALARIVASIDSVFIWQSLHQNLYEVVYRLPHGIAPLIVYWMLQNSRKQDRKIMDDFETTQNSIE
ncbi:DoxX-like family protein [Aquimarina sp. W85]|uniref:DoxX-like family protein n=1 Tax=Aquimarina rhodophyticola TaxID=3342246 RepID=UPI003672E7D8